MPHHVVAAGKEGKLPEQELDDAAPVDHFGATLVELHARREEGPRVVSYAHHEVRPSDLHEGLVVEL
jgi:hypothetical protein